MVDAEQMLPSNSLQIAFGMVRIVTCFFILKNKLDHLFIILTIDKRLLAAPSRRRHSRAKLKFEFEFVPRSMTTTIAFFAPEVPEFGADLMDLENDRELALVFRVPLNDVYRFISSRDICPKWTKFLEAQINATQSVASFQNVDVAVL